MHETLDAGAIYAALREHHLPRMRNETKRALVLRTVSRDLRAIAEAEAVSVATVRARLNSGLSDIFETIVEPVERDGWTAATWVGLHRGCCLPEAHRDLREFN